MHRTYVRTNIWLIWHWSWMKVAHMRALETMEFALAMCTYIHTGHVVEFVGGMMMNGNGKKYVECRATMDWLKSKAAASYVWEITWGTLRWRNFISFGIIWDVLQEYLCSGKFNLPDLNIWAVLGFLIEPEEMIINSVASVAVIFFAWNYWD